MSTESFIRFNCPECGKHLRVGAIQAGKRGKCPKCHAILEVPEGRGESSEPRVNFKCPGCGKAIRVPAEYAGKRGKCPKCETLMRIPDPPRQVCEEPTAEDSTPAGATGIDAISGEQAPGPKSPQDPSHERSISPRLPAIGIIVYCLLLFVVGLATGIEEIIDSGIMTFVIALLLLIPTALMQILVHWFYGFKPKYGSTYACYLLGYIGTIITLVVVVLAIAILESEPLTYPEPTGVSSEAKLALFTFTAWFVLTAGVSGAFLKHPEKGSIGFGKACLPLFIVGLILYLTVTAAVFFVVRST